MYFSRKSLSKIKLHSSKQKEPKTLILNKKTQFFLKTTFLRKNKSFVISY
jgi:hypothetical protein